MKSHLALSETPLTDHRPVTAICGAKVEDSVTVCVWDDTPVMAQIVWPLGVCRKCIGAAVSESRNYVYVVSPGT
jgi:hypothetical protein